MATITLLPEDILDILLYAAKTRTLSARDYCELALASSDEFLEDEYKKSVVRLLRSVRRGLVKVVTDLELVA